MSQTFDQRRRFAIMRHYCQKKITTYEFSFFYRVTELDGSAAYDVSFESIFGMGRTQKEALKMAGDMAYANVVQSYLGAKIKLVEYHVFNGDYVTMYARPSFGN